MTGAPDRSAFNAIQLADGDTIGHALTPLDAGSVAQMDSPNGTVSIEIREPIPLYHKFATLDLEAGAQVIKGGEIIGRTRSPVRAGTHVHIHNLASDRELGTIKGEA